MSNQRAKAERSKAKDMRQMPAPGGAMKGKRNAYMLTLEPDGVVAFPGGRGTADMVRQARKAGIKVMEVERCRLS